MQEPKKIKVTFAPGSFDNFEGTQEELDELVAQIHQLFQNPDNLNIVSADELESFDDTDFSKTFH